MSGCRVEEGSRAETGKASGKTITIALAGNANVGKSVIFNQLTGLHQHVGNWPGKTVKRAEGTLVHSGCTIDVVDLPGIYSLSTFSLEERVSREYIAVEHPDVLVDVVDASALERNLFFTIQLLELEPHLIVALNQMDMAEKRGVRIDVGRLSATLGVPVVPTVASRNVGIDELVDEVISYVEKKTPTPSPPLYGQEIEARIRAVAEAVRRLETPYPARWAAIKLIEGDEEVEGIVYSQAQHLRELIEGKKYEMESLHGHDPASVVASERYAAASRIADEVSAHEASRPSIWGKMEELTDHPIIGYVIMFLVILGMFYSIFTLGDFSSALLGRLFDSLKAVYFGVLGGGQVASFVWGGLIEGLIAGTTIALPYIIPFFVVLSLLEDSGYLARVAFLMDSAMHRIGLHGKGFIPLMLGFGCNVPACLGCSIMETERERLICAFVASLIPCAARSIVIMGLVAAYLGFGWAAVLYVIDFALIFALGRIAFKVVPGEPVGLIMEMPSYKRPSLKLTAQRTWLRLKGFVYEAFPIMIVGNLIIRVADMVGLLNLFQGWLSPVTVSWLGLPTATGIVLIFGVLRKELTLILLASIMGTTNFSLILSPTQMFVFAFVVMIYVPCLATIAVLTREFGVRKAAVISLTEIALAVVLGGVLYRVLLLIGLA